MKLWLDGQCLQTPRRRATCGVRAVHLLRRITQENEQVEVHVSLNAQWIDEAVAARRYLDEHLPMARVHVWQSVLETYAVSRETPGHRLSRLALAHHINCLAPDLALFSNSFPVKETKVSDSTLEVFPEICKIFCVAIEILYLENLNLFLEDNMFKLDFNFFILQRIKKFNQLVIDSTEISAKTIDKIIQDNHKLFNYKIHNLNLNHSSIMNFLNLLKNFSENKSMSNNGVASQNDQMSKIKSSRSYLTNSVFYGDTNMNGYAAKVMALSEPSQSRSPRFLFDSTSTLKYNSHVNNGIQRVVRRLSDYLYIKTHKTESKLVVFDENIPGFIEIFNKTNHTKDNLISSNHKDILVLADSTWDILSSMRTEIQKFVLYNNKVIVVFYDIIPINFPGFTTDKLSKILVEYLKFCILNATAIVCISRAVADELYLLLDEIKFPYEIKIGFWQLGKDFLNKNVKYDHVNIALKQPKCLTFIAVGTIEIRKGYRVILEAFEKLWNEDWDIELKLVGKKGWLNDHFINRLKQHPELGRRLHWYQRVDDHGLVSLYNEADALVFASYAEGFGLPIVEAAGFGKPVIVSDIPVFREVSAAAPRAFFFEPGSAQDLANQIRNFSRESGNSATAKPKPVAWPNWAESMEQLKSVVLKDQYYKNYRPKAKQDPFATGYIGEIYTQSYLSEISQKYRLKLVDEPHKSQCKRFFNVIFSVKNLSDKIYSSNQDFNYNLGIRLAARPIGGSSLATGYMPAFADIPFVLLPGHQHIMRISCPCVWWRNGATVVQVDLLQVLPDTYNWWGRNPLLVDLPS